MFFLTTTTDTICAEITARLSDLMPGADIYDRASLDAMSTQLATTIARIHTQGIASDGSPIGSYKKPQGRSIVTLTGTGALRDGLGVLKTTSGCGLGWSDTRLYEIALDLEQHYAKKIWAPTDAEHERMIDRLRDFCRLVKK